LVCAPHLADLGVNLFNFSFEHGLDEMRELCGPSVALLGNLPPRDVLAGKSPDEVRQEAQKMVADVNNRAGLLFSCGGGMPQDVTSEQIRAFCEGVQAAW
jgi:uroporphyrinogen decarboxylase